MSHYKPDPNKSVNLTIDGLPVTVPEGTTILKAAGKVNVRIPTLCDYPDLCRRAVCRLCVVECDGRGKLLAACANDVSEGMNVVTNNARIQNIRKTIVELILASHPQECLSCIRNNKCELQKLAADFGIRTSPFRRYIAERRTVETACETLVRDMSKCVKCGRCVEVCQEVQTIRAINTSHRSIDYEICTPYSQALNDGPCVFCGQCAMVCPVGAIYEHDDTDGVWAALNKSGQCVIAQFSPLVRTALTTELGLPPDTITSGKIVTALKMMGFKMVLDAGYFSDLVVMEEGRELLDRIKNSFGKSKLPMVSGCSSGLIKFIKDGYGDLLDHLSASISHGKSPQQNFGTFVKANYPQVSGVDRSKITAVSFVSCIAKKYEARIPLAKEPQAGGQRPDLDFSLTTRELAGMIRLAGIDFCNLPESPYDCVKSDCVKSDSLVFAYDKKSRQGIKETEVDLNGTTVKVLVVNGLANARIVLDAIRRGECDAAFVEIMNCPGCIADDGYEVDDGCEADDGCEVNGTSQP